MTASITSVFSLFRPHKKYRAAMRRAISVVAEQLETRLHLTAATDAAILAAVPANLIGEFNGTELQLSQRPSTTASTPTYTILDESPSLTSRGRLAPSSTSAPSGFSPAQITQAYGIDNIEFGSVTGDGLGQTIAIIDAYDDPTAYSDLQAFDRHFGLADPPSFTKVNQTGGSVLPRTEDNDPHMGSGSDWEVEEALDVEWTHAIAPEASIVLVEATLPTDADLLTAAVGWARSAPGISAVSMSFTGGESETETNFDPLFTTPAGHGGVTFLASTGDDGAPGGYPAYSPNVVAVGGTQLTTTDASGDYGTESGWIGSGGGISYIESQPAYQSAVVTQSSTQRTIPDVAFDAAPASGVPIYDSYDFGTGKPWITVGGTSVGAPCWAGLIAIADQGRAINELPSLDGSTQTLPLLYSMPASNFNDITSGNNIYGAGFGYYATAGYDLVTGRGTPIANSLVPFLGETTVASISTTIAPPSDVIPGTSASYSFIVQNDGTDEVDNVSIESSMAAAIGDGELVPGTIAWSATPDSNGLGQSATSTNGSGSGDISDIVDLPAGTNVTYCVTGLLDPSATGPYFGGGETMTATVPSGVVNTEATGGTNNTYLFTNPTPIIVDPPQSDILIAMSGSDPLAIGSPDVYNIVVRNVGPSNTDDNLSIYDALPGYLGDLTYTSTVVDPGYSALDDIPVTVAGNTSDSTPQASLTLNDSLLLPAGAVVDYTIAGTVASLPTSGPITNTVTASDATMSDLGNLNPDGDTWNLASTVNSTTVDASTNTVVGRYLFYGGSEFGTQIAADKTSLQAGQLSNFNNYSNYLGGIDGMYIDIAGLTPTQATAIIASESTGSPDISFKYGFGNPSGSSVAHWSVFATPTVTVVGYTAGVDGAARLQLTWPEFPYSEFGDGVTTPYVAGYGAGQGPLYTPGFSELDYSVFAQWIQVVVNSNNDTGLQSQDVFYFGSAPASVGGDTSDSFITDVTTLDTSLIEQYSYLPSSAVTIASQFDTNKDGSVDSSDISSTWDWAGGIAGTLGAPVLDATLPTAILSASDISPDATTYNFTVTYGDAVNGIDVTSLNSDNVLVTGPDGYSQLAVFVSSSTSGSDNTVVGTYQISQPSGVGAWGTGPYVITLQSSQVRDVTGNYATSDVLGTVNVATP